jgi:hypothetical protein
MLKPITKHSIIEKENKNPVAKPRATNITELARVTRNVFFRVVNNFIGCISKPNKNSKNIMPNSAMSVSKEGSEIYFRPKGPRMTPMKM